MSQVKYMNVTRSAYKIYFSSFFLSAPKRISCVKRRKFKPKGLIDSTFENTSFLAKATAEACQNHILISEPTE